MFIKIINIVVNVSTLILNLKTNYEEEAKMKQISIDELNENAFKMIGSDWLLLTAKKGDKVNTMTASWGGVGIMWNKPVAYIFVRPQRYTKEFIDASDSLSISVLPNSFKKTLSYLGTVSGRDEDKIAKSGLTVKDCDNVPYFEEARLAFICKKLYAQSLEKECFIDQSLIEKCYAANDYHVMYVVEIEKILE